MDTLYNVLGNLVFEMLMEMHPIAYREPHQGLIPPRTPQFGGVGHGGPPPPHPRRAPKVPLCDAQLKDICLLVKKSTGVGVVICTR